MIKHFVYFYLMAASFASLSIYANANECPNRPANFRDVDLRADFGPVTDQDSVGYCYAHTSASMMNYYLKSQGVLDTTQRENMISPVALGAQYDSNYGLNLQREVIRRRVSSMSDTELTAEIQRLRTAKEAQLVNGEECSTEDLACARSRASIEHINTQIAAAESWQSSKSFGKELDIGDDGGVGYISFIDGLEQGVCLESEVNSLDYIIPQTFNEQLNQNTTTEACEGLTPEIVKDALNKHGIMKYTTSGEIDILSVDTDSVTAQRRAELIEFLSIDIEGDTEQERLANAEQFYNLLLQIKECDPIEINPRKVLNVLADIAKGEGSDDLQCEDYLQLANTLPGAELSDIRALLREFENNNTDFFSSTFDLQCDAYTPNVPVPNIRAKNFFRSSSDYVVAELDQALSQNKPIAIGYTPTVFDGPVNRENLPTLSTFLGAGHGSTVVGKIFNCDRGEEFYIVRNSWGANGCSVFESMYPFPDENGNKPFYCDEEGNFLVEKNHLANSVFRTWTYE